MKLDSFSHEAERDARLNLAHVITKYDCDVDALTKADWFSVKPMDYNAIRAADMEAMAEIALTLGREKDVAMWQSRVEAIHNAFQAKMMINDLPYDLEGLEERPIRQDSALHYSVAYPLLSKQNESLSNFTNRASGLRFRSQLHPPIPTDIPTATPFPTVEAVTDTSYQTAPPTEEGTATGRDWSDSGMFVVDQ